MEKEIVSKLSNRLNVEYWITFFLLMALFLFTVFTPIRIKIINNESLISIRSLTILYTLAMIPFSLKFFHSKIQKIEALLPLAQKATFYIRYTRYRLMILSSIVLVNEFLFFITRDKSDIIMSLIGVIALIFCIIHKNQIEKDLLPSTKETDESITSK